MQLKIKIALAPALETQEPAPFDRAKIARFSITVVGVVILAALLFLNFTQANKISTEPVAAISNKASESVVNEASIELETSEPENIIKALPAKATDTEMPMSVESPVDAPDGIEPTPPMLELATLSVRQSPASLPVADELDEDKGVQVDAVQQNIVATPTSENVVIGQKPSFILRSVLTSAVINREPVDKLTDLVSLAAHKKVFFYTHLIDLEGQQVEHRWYFDKELKAVVTLAVGSANWRTYSSKVFNSSLVGTWRVEVVAPSNKVLDVHYFDVSH